MGQMLVWLSFAEIFGTAATIQMLQVSLYLTHTKFPALSLSLSIYIYISQPECIAPGLCITDREKGSGGRKYIITYIEKGVGVRKYLYAPVFLLPIHPKGVITMAAVARAAAVDS